jgi:hypothetical protein
MASDALAPARSSAVTEISEISEDTLIEVSESEDEQPRGNDSQYVVDPLDVPIFTRKLPNAEDEAACKAFKTKFPCSEVRRLELFGIFQTAKRRKLEELRQRFASMA